MGALVGLVVALCSALFVGATGGVTKLDVIGEGASIEPVFSIPASAFWMVAIITGVVCGLVVAIATRAIAIVIDPDTTGASSWVIASLGAVVGGVVAFSVFPLGVTLLGSVQDGLATVSVADFVLLSAVAGITGGAIIVWQSYIMARPPQAQQDPELLAP